MDSDLCRPTDWHWLLAWHNNCQWHVCRSAPLLVRIPGTVGNRAVPEVPRSRVRPSARIICRKSDTSLRANRFIFATESYGGHYGPEFVTYFDQQNAKIDQGIVQGAKITVNALMINKYVIFFAHYSCTSYPASSGWYDPLLQNEAYVQFATNAPGYGQLQSNSVIASLNTAFFGSGGCQEQEQACYAAGTGTSSNTVCKNADNFCVRPYLLEPSESQLTYMIYEGRKCVRPCSW